MMDKDFIQQLEDFCALTGKRLYFIDRRPAIDGGLLIYDFENYDIHIPDNMIIYGNLTLSNSHVTFGRNVIIDGDLNIFCKDPIFINEDVIVRGSINFNCNA